MSQGNRILTASVAVFALAFVQGCYGPGRARAGAIAPETRVFVTRTSLLTLHHTREGVARECTTREALGTVVRMTPDSIVLRDLRIGNATTTGECRIAGEAFVVLADQPGLAVRPRAFSPGRTLGLLIIVVPIVIGIGVVILYAGLASGGYT